MGKSKAMLEKKSSNTFLDRNQGDLYPLDMATKDFKDRLKLARQQAGSVRGSKVTQVDVANHLGVTPQAVSGWERGEDMPELKKINALSDFLGVDVAWLLGKKVTSASLNGDDQDFVRKPTLQAFPHEEILGRIDLPVFSTANGGRGALVLSNEPYTHVARPHNLLGIRESYGVLVKGNSMAKEYNENDIAYVDPVRHPKKDDPCVFQNRAEDGTVTAIIKYLDRSPDSHETLYFVYQTNPLKKFTIKKADWQSCNVLVGKIAGPG
jgi:transcriptional regulator with XRE-family HTH domain